MLARQLLVSFVLCAACADVEQSDPRSDAGEERELDAGPGRPGADASKLDAARADATRPVPEQTRDSQAADAARDDAGEPVLRQVMRINNPPSYRGSVDNSVACSMLYPTAGYAPVMQTGERLPLFLYFVGTAFLPDDASARVDSAAPMAVTEAVAKRGFVALSVRYDNTPLAWLSDHKNQLPCLFDESKVESLLAVACALPSVDCERGIATWGHSQGGLVAHMAFNYDARVRAVWTTGYGGEALAKLDKTRLRVANGEADGSNSSATTLTNLTGLTSADCPDPDSCFRADGSGWSIVRVRDLATPGATADHCWFDRQSCGAAAIVLEPSWVGASSSKSFALERNVDWLVATLQRP